MIDRSLLEPSAIGQTLRSLAGKVEHHGDGDAGQRLRLLGEAVEKRLPPSITWSSIDISKFIDADGIAERYSQRTTNRTGCMLELVEIFRNVFIFVPIIVTWFGISQATASYNAFVSAALAKNDTTLLAEPFLYLWQQGFDKRLPGLWTLSSIAVMDVIVLSIIIILTLVSHTLSNANRLQEERNAHDLHAKLVHAVARASLSLNDGQHQHQLVGGSGSSQNLDQVAIEVRDMAANIARTFTQLGTDMMARFDTIVDTMTQQFKKIADDLSAQLQQGGKFLGTLGNAANALQKLAVEMNTAANKLIKANQEMTKSVSDLIDPAKDLAQLQQQLLQSVDKSVLLLDSNATTLEEIAKQHTNLINDLVVSLGSVRTTTQQMGDIFIKLEDFIIQQEKLVIEMKGERIEQERLSHTMAQAMLNTQETQKSLKALAISFRQIAVDTQQTMRLYAGMPKNIGTDIAVAVQVIEKGGGDLSSAAMSIFSASQHFEKVVADQEQLVNMLVSSGKI